ncbi:MAG: D-alanine--D-alanine ligase, partial [Planctomycetes bacterium]|nr:D-alanine--D-alanine ligase [Planctomycetota bacterium]
MAKATILVLHNQPVLPRDHPDAESEHSVVAIAEKIVGVLARAGYRAAPFALGSDPSLLWSALKKEKPNAVFNLFEGNPHQPETESYVAGLLDWAGVPYTGSPAATLSLARAKHATKHLLKGAGLPTADFLVVDALPLPAQRLPFPVIVKPARQDASVGMDQSSVCVNALQLERRVEHLLRTFGAPVLVETYIDGREFHVPLMELPELEPLSVLEITFPPEPSAWPILTYASKWERDAPPTFAINLPR